MKSAISENKLKAFSISRTTLSKQEKMELKRKEDEKKTQEVYKDFVASFEGSKSNVKTFVRGQTINADEKTESSKKSRLYKPAMKLPAAAEPSMKDFNSAPKMAKPDRPTLKKKDDKRKSNLELFKEELKVIQKEREQRHNAKRTGKMIIAQHHQETARSSRFEPLDDKLVAKVAATCPSILDDLVENSQCADPMTTNLFLGNVNPRMDEQQLCELFGKYGPLASVKVMWPRTDEERARERNCAFVAYMTRRDADRALRHLQGRDVMGFEMKLGWGKTVPIPPHPVYVPQVLLERTMPPPPSGLPFNAQPMNQSKKRTPGMPPLEFKDKADFERTLKNSIVRVVVPTERNLLCLIHRMVEFVVREGPMFEAMIMNRELSNPMFRFLFENQSPAHVYYRWRIFSVLQGESPDKYRTSDFRLFKDGSLWRPPPLNPYIDGLAETDSEDELPLHKSSKHDGDTSRRDEPEKKAELQEEDRDVLEDILRNLLPRQKLVGEAMVFCLDHSDWADEIVQCIVESLSILETPLTKKIARLYLISDILHNSSAKVSKASFFRKHFERQLEQVMLHLHACHKAICSRLRAEQFKQKVLACFRAWDDWAIYPDKFLIHLQNTFLGLVTATGGVPKAKKVEAETVSSEDAVGVGEDTMKDDTNDGEDDDDDDVDGIPIDDDLDGVPLETSEKNDANKTPATAATPVRPRFVQSKWETVDPEDVQSQAMTTSKWDTLEPTSNIDGDPLEEEVTEEVTLEGQPKEADEDKSAVLDATKRARLREIEVKVMKFQDELENGQREKNPQMSISSQVDQYRTKLMERDAEKETKRSRGSGRDEKKKDRKKERSSSDSSESSSERSKKKKRKKARDSPKKGLVTYDSDDSSPSPRRSSSSALSSSKKKKSVRTRSRSRDRHSSKHHSRGGSPSSSSHRSGAKSPKRALKRSRSRSRERKKRRKSNKH